MKKMLFTFSLLLGLFFTSAAQQILIEGFVYSGNQPEADIEVNLNVMWSNNHANSYIVISDSSGRFSTYVQRPQNNTQQGILVASLTNCNGVVITDRKVITINQNRLGLKLEYCRSEQSRCAVTLRRELGEDSTIYLVAHALGTAPFTYLWNDGTISDRVVASEGRNYCVTITDANGCQASACVKNNVDQRCRVLIRRHSTQHGEVLIANVLPNGPARYRWSTGATTQRIVVNEPGRYCVTVTTASGCNATSCILVRPNDNTGQCIRGGIRQILNNNNTATLSFTPAQNTFEYNWSTGEDTQSINVNQSGIYYLTVTDTSKENCSAVFKVLVHLPACDATILIRQIDSTNLMLIVQPGIPNARIDGILWSTGDDSQTIIVEQGSGVYCVTISYHNCTATTCISTDSLNGNIGIQLLSDNDDHYYLQVYSDNQNDLIVWNTGETGSRIIPELNQFHEVYLLQTDGSILTANIDLSSFNSSNQSLDPNSLELRLFPNPVGKDQQLNINGLSEGLNELFIYNTHGQILMRTQIYSPSSAESHQIETSRFAPGLYFIDVKNERGNSGTKFIKH